MKHEDKRLKRRVRNSYIVSTVSIAMVLFLLGSVSYLILNALTATDKLKESVAIYVMLGDMSEKEREGLRTQVLNEEAVREVKFVSKEEAAADFKDYIGSDFVEFLEYNPLPDSFELRLEANLSDKETVKELDKKLSAMKGVGEVVYQKGVIEQISSNINKFNLILLLFGGTLLVISLILLNNTIRVNILVKRRVINTMKLVGATKGFIMRPFIGSAVLHGIYAGAIATIMFAGMIVGLREGLPEVSLLSGNMIILYIAGGMIAGGVVISLLFTTFAVNKFVNMSGDKAYMY
jgi:cell division transport system permease protein